MSSENFDKTRLETLRGRLKSSSTTIPIEVEDYSPLGKCTEAQWRECPKNYSIFLEELP